MALRNHNLTEILLVFLDRFDDISNFLRHSHVVWLMRKLFFLLKLILVGMFSDDSSLKLVITVLLAQSFGYVSVVFNNF